MMIPIFVALDMPSVDDAVKLAETLGDEIDAYKIGLTLLGQPGGVLLAQTLRAEGKLVFQDWKLHDISAQVSGAVASIAPNADFLTVHGEPQVIKAAMDAKAKLPKHAKSVNIMAVTVLTSLSDEDLQEIGYHEKAADLVARRATAAFMAGCDGVITSPREVAKTRQIVGNSRVIITPGVRLPGNEQCDQVRIDTPQNAMRNGADFVVVGRPITAAPNPVEAAKLYREAVTNL
jgi:orotidine-5'-phosphate decarboxylase